MVIYKLYQQYCLPDHEMEFLDTRYNSLDEAQKDEYNQIVAHYIEFKDQDNSIKDIKELKMNVKFERWRKEDHCMYIMEECNFDDWTFIPLSSIVSDGVLINRWVEIEK